MTELRDEIHRGQMIPPLVRCRPRWAALMKRVVAKFWTCLSLGVLL
jgi:hypothetical protein